MRLTGGMDSPTLLAHLDRQLTAYADGLGQVDADDHWLTPVPCCPGWAVRDLTHHLIGLHYWVADAINGGVRKEYGHPMPADDGLAAAFLTSAAMLQAALDQNPRTACWTFDVGVANGAGTVGFWQRRQPHEHAIHLWDLEKSLALTPTGYRPRVGSRQSEPD